MRPWVPLLALSITACGLFDGADGELATLLRNRDRWTAMQIRDYDFEYRLSCYCPTEALEPVRIEVRNALVDRVVSLRNGADVTQQQFVRWPTVDSLFAWTERNFDGSYELEITYDRNFRFPARVAGDIPRYVDDEFTRTAQNLIPR